VQRLQSLKKRTPAGSISPSGRPPSALSGEQAKPTLKYKPRAVGRRSKEEREAIEKLEQERYNERLKEAAAIQRGRRGAASTNIRGGFRGRGGPMGMSMGAGAMMSGRRGRGGGAGGGGSGYDSRHSSAVGPRSRTRSHISGGNIRGGDLSDDEDGLRVSIDQINLESSDEEEYTQSHTIKGKMPIRERRERGLRPVRVERHPHEERVVSVNMESSLSEPARLREKARAKATEDSALFVDDDRPDTTAAAEEPRVKQEDDDAVMTDDIPHADDDELLPAQKVRVRRKLAAQKATEESLPEPESSELEAARDPRRLLRTREEIEEYERHQHDLEVVQHLFSKPVEKPETTEAQPAEGEEAETAAEERREDDQDAEAETSAKSCLAGRLFLMQFPPMTPNLTIPGTAENQPEPTASATTMGQAEQPEVKAEGDEVEIVEGGQATTTRPPGKIVTAAADTPLPAGRVGKFNVHRSGRITLDWGGISFELDRAAEVDFVQEALVVSSVRDDDVADETPERRVWAMGQLGGKFTVTPEWDALL
jgi:DNA-directed RNA polymerase III subunit RPC4